MKNHFGYKFAVSSDLILGTSGFKEEDYGRNVGLLILLWVFYRGLNFGISYYKFKKIQ